MNMIEEEVSRGSPVTLSTSKLGQPRQMHSIDSVNENVSVVKDEERKVLLTII